MERQVVNPLDLILVQKETIEGMKTPKGVLVESPQVISVEEQVAQIVEVSECVVLQELQMILLRRRDDKAVSLISLWVNWYTKITKIHGKMDMNMFSTVWECLRGQ